MSKQKTERLVRTFAVSDLRMEKREDGDGHVITGHAAVFNSLSEELWPGVKEKIASGAFSNVLGDDVRLLFNHDPNHVLGRTKSGTLTLSQDAVGLRIKADVPDTQTARDLAVLMARGDVDAMSFAFSVDPQDVRNEPVEGGSVDTILKVKSLYDVSVVTYPAYPAASASFRAFEPSEQTSEISTSETAPEGQPPKGGAGESAAEKQPLRAAEIATVNAQLDSLDLAVQSTNHRA